MIGSRSIASSRRRNGPAGFTMIELLVVILILAVLIALLLPAINGAVRSAKNGATGAEINQLAQALASFKSKYGDYPPSRILLAESGNYSAYIGTNASNTLLGTGDISIGQLAQRSVSVMRKFFGNVGISTSGPVPGVGVANFYDFNGNNTLDAPYILQGHECLVFFLGGIPFQDSSGAYSMTGFAKDPKNPFKNSIPLLTNGNPNPMYSNNRTPPLFEFNSGRLHLDPFNSVFYPTALSLIPALIPAYNDSLGNSYSSPDAVNHLSGVVNFYAYFSAYGNGGYDPNDVNIPEFDSLNSIAGLSFRVNFPPGVAVSPPPNPYTSSFSAPATGVATYQNPQTFQIISSGIDGLYGLGGRYDSNSADSIALDTSAPTPYTTNDVTIRVREKDNITNFHNGRLD